MSPLLKNTLDMHNVDVQEFFKVVDECKGAVYLITEDGNRLNLKSKLCQIIGITKLIQGGSINEVEIACDDKEDESKLFRFNLYGKSPIK
ncbi:MAG: hypothetical protein RR436_06785 [Clostridia bacterium]